MINGNICACTRPSTPTMTSLSHPSSPPPPLPRSMNKGQEPVGRRGQLWERKWWPQEGNYERRRSDLLLTWQVIRRAPNRLIGLNNIESSLIVRTVGYQTGHIDHSQGNSERLCKSVHKHIAHARNTHAIGWWWSVLPDRDRYARLFCWCDFLHLMN